MAYSVDKSRTTPGLVLRHKVVQLLTTFLLNYGLKMTGTGCSVVDGCFLPVGGESRVVAVGDTSARRVFVEVVLLPRPRSALVSTKAVLVVDLELQSDVFGRQRSAGSAREADATLVVAVLQNCEFRGVDLAVSDC